MAWWMGRKDGNGPEGSEKLRQVYDDIQEAHRDWVNAQQHFEYAIGKDQIDYAIFAIEAAEKRYEMLLRQAKSLGGGLLSKHEEEAG
ncbi:DUF2508 family protein [Paenibacillus sp. GCM10012307]|uniref:YaaL family protein n=1 Tax=Paenibacillus roseus TaxID=2798579 RepID=A0A934IWM4_9BACL|nr:DUF2508 family protein [Paenibacillus roseus]MBJ6360661.1 YaaL family protein [Paenibacillus roseus]